MPTPQENQVKERYASAAQQLEPALCCPVDYDPQLLKAIPPEVIERDYGCGDPSRYLKEGERVLDLGSGTGKVCFMASQVVGPKGKVIGRIALPERCANICFGGVQRNRLFMAASQSIYALYVNTQGVKGG